MLVRAYAAEIVYDVLYRGRSLSDCLPQVLALCADKRDQALLQALCYGTCRWYFRLERMLNPLLHKPFKAKDQDIYALLLIGFYQLTEMRIPHYAAISETVAATAVLKKPWAKKMVNAVLRQFERQQNNSTQAVSKEMTEVEHYAHPAWLIEKIKHDWPDHWQAILTANNQPPPMALRVNPIFFNREDYLKKLSDAKEAPFTSCGILLAQPMDVHQLPGFNDGAVSVQDSAAQLAAELLDLKPAERVLDACAAPGGKTAHILEAEPTVTLIAVDQSEKRLEKVHENLTRLKLQATCFAADVANTAEWWDGVLFDRILLDAPCSASGVVRRHPDIKLLRRPTDIPPLAREQSRLLEALWPLLKPGGLLLYVTCSIFPEENVMILSGSMARHADMREEKIIAPWGVPCLMGRQILPGMHDMDGFYFARLRKGQNHLCG